MPNRTSHKFMRPGFHLLLVTALLFLGWLQLAHQSDLHAHEDNGSCEICLFAANVHDGVTYTPPTLPAQQAEFFYRLPIYQSPTLPYRTLLRPTQRGPPNLSIA